MHDLLAVKLTKPQAVTNAQLALSNTQKQRTERRTLKVSIVLLIIIFIGATLLCH